MKRKILSGIYQIKNIINNKKYIGKSKNILKRFYNHKTKLRNNCHRNKHLQDSWNKYGEENFEFIILISFSKYDNKKLSKLEKFYIKKLKTKNKKYGYNYTDGGEGTVGWKPSKETKEKISKSNTGKIRTEEQRKRNSIAQTGKIMPKSIKEKISKALSGKLSPNFGKHPSQETRYKMSLARKKRVTSKETREKISKSHRGKRHPMYGKHHSEETKRKISESLKGEKNPNFGKIFSDETRKKLSENNANKGKKMALKTRKKISESKKKYWENKRNINNEIQNDG